MEWIKIDKNNKPKEKGMYMCFVSDCKLYNKHWGEYYWDGKNFVDNTYMGRGKIVEATHYLIIVEPE